ncbi:hypothetical protein [Geobacillus virus E2]|uniref:hypothetical protein n=1 Tax=Geobacillus virus E2 TaxID=447909 RepID=UPI0001536807|nr:hypothetical protein GBVE2_p51 [Geobacillus virus E2]ABI36869.1 hypothetical protein [Geobacillus virus E2]
MKEIKYRAWDGKNLLQVEAIHFDVNTVEVIVPCDAIDCEGHPFEYSFDEVVIMQYTGLKDKNGTEIYEGDVIRDNDGFLWVVYFEDGMYCAKGGEYETVEYLIEFCPEWCEVISNIYEHPHLLGGEEE